MGPTENQIEKLRSEQAQIGRAIVSAICTLANIVKTHGQGVGTEDIALLIDRMPKP